MPPDKKTLMQYKQMTAYLAPEGFVRQMVGELTDVRAVCGRLVITRGPPQPSCWAQNIWLEPRILAIRSIGDGAKLLRGIQRNWAMYAFRYHRRSTLIQEKLPYVSAKPLHFPEPEPQAPLGSWALLEPDLMLASPRCSSAFAHGQVTFVECRQGPPSRAYLKLWEAFTLIRRMPRPGEQCLDAGASPGGWTWVLQKLGARVLAVDRSELEPEIMRQPGVTFRKEDAFSIRPETDGPYDWIFCDVACYPEKLLRWVSLWLASGKCRNFVCTVKFQGDSHYDVIKAFAAIPRAVLRHLFHNKHELTWMCLDENYP